MIKLLIGGSPCTYWSIAKQKNRETEPSGIGWELFENYLIAKEKFKPDFFLYENNKSAAQAIKDEIKKRMNVWDGSLFMEDTGARYIEINSALVSAQNRQRFYVHNCGEVGQPEDRGVLFWRDIKEKNYCKCEKYKAKKTPSRIRMWNNGNGGGRKYTCKNITMAEKTGTVTTNQDRSICAGLIEFEDFFRYLTVEECCKLQTLPPDYCKSLSKNQAYKCIGNGWTAEVIIHILNGALKDIPRDEKIVVLSMYDGIGTGRYCLDKMGFTNVEYHAFEIDKYAIKVSMSNYPDIIQHGDAYQVRKDNFKI